MSAITLRPNATTTLVGASVVGGASAHAVLADDLDSTYVVLGASGTGVILAMADLTLPAGALVKSTQVRTRVSISAGNATYIIIVGSPVTNYLLIYQQAALTITFPLDTRDQTDAFVDSYAVYVGRIAGLATPAYLFALYLDVVYAEKPDLVVSAPTGVVADTNLPTVTWAPDLDVDGGLQTAYEVTIFSAAQYGAGGFDPATSPSVLTTGKVLGAATSWAPSVPLPDASYRAYVRIWQEFRPANGHVSDRVFTAFSVAVAVPAVPTLGLTADSAQGLITLSIDDVAGAATTEAVEVERSLDLGETWEAIRSELGLQTLFDGVPGPLVLEDYEAPNGVAVSYRARALHDYSGVFAASAWTTATATWSSRHWWIKHPANPALNMPVTLKMYGGVTQAARQGVFQAHGATLPLVIGDTRAGPAGQITVRVETADELAELVTLLGSPATLLLQGPAAAGEPDRYVRFGDMASSRVVELEWLHIKDVPIGWTEVARPSSALQVA